jgi:hypothetical protein
MKERAMKQSGQSADWHTPSERMPTFDDGPRRFTNKVEVEVECALGIELRNCFVGGGFDDDDCLGKRVVRWRSAVTN